MWAQVLRFGGVGGAATVLHVTVALAVQTLFQATGQVANLAGFAAAVLLSYLGHARYTFGVDAQSGPQFVRFLLLSGLGLATSSATVWLVATKLGFGFTVAMVAVAIVVPTASYLAMRFWVFQHR